MSSANGGRYLEGVVARPAPPRWAVASVKCCVVGLLAWPFCAPLVLVVGSLALGAGAEHFRSVATPGLIGLGMFMLGLAQTLTTHFPPAP